MTDYTPDPALVDQLAALVRVRIGWPISHGEAATIVTATLQGLATEGRLLPGPVLAVHTSDGRVYHPSDVQFAVGPWLPVPEGGESA